MTNAAATRFLVIDSCTRPARGHVPFDGASIAADLYVDMLKWCGPTGTGFDIIFPADPGVGLPGDSRLRRRHMALREGSPACRPDGEPHVVRRAGRVDCFVCGAGQFQGTLDRNHLRAITISTATDSPNRYRPRKFASRGVLHRARTGLRRAALDLLAHHQSVPPV